MKKILMVVLFLFSQAIAMNPGSSNQLSGQAWPVDEATFRRLAATTAMTLQSAVEASTPALVTELTTKLNNPGFKFSDTIEKVLREYGFLEPDGSIDRVLRDVLAKILSSRASVERLLQA